MIPLANHLWQSTLFAALVAVAAFTLRNNSARTRHWLWFAASLKFLLPFSLLMSLGGELAWQPATAVTTKRPVAAAVEQAGEALMLLTLSTVPETPVLPAVLALVWLVGFAVTLFVWCRHWKVLNTARRMAHPANLAAPLPVMVTPARLEPGLFGLFRPVLLLPQGLVESLSEEQMDAILAHEWCHARRRDNLLAALHMAVESIFWFHPVVWWIGARLMEERERACDEEVLRLGKRPEAYAEGILNVCESYLRSSLACAPGVTGGQLQARIREILSGRSSRRLTLARVAFLATAAAAAFLLPLLVGIVQAQGPLTFDVATIKPANPDERNSLINITPGGGINVRNVPVRHIIEFAYGMRESQVIGGPGWLGSTNFDIVARVDKPTGPTDFRAMDDIDRRTMEAQIRQRIQSLLADRFQLRIRHDTQEMPVQALVVAKNGLKITPVASGDKRPPQMRMSRGTLSGQRIPMKEFAQALSRLLSRTVIDQTGATGEFDFTMSWAPDADPAAEGPSLPTALTESLGLRLESKKAPVDVIVIEQIEKPTEN